MASFYLDRIYGIFWIIYWFHHFPDENDEKQPASQKYSSPKAIVYVLFHPAGA
jgi:hypothetical protein